MQGVQQGWATPLMSEGRPLRIGIGEYAVTAAINPTYAELFGMTPEEASRTLTLEVVDASVTEPEPPHEHRAAVPAPRTAPTGAPGRADEDGPMPDLESLPAWGISLSKNSTYLRFSATVWNSGDSPLVVDGSRREGEDLMDAEWKPEHTDLATSCGDISSLSIREVLAAGRGDTYTQYRAGQSFTISDLPNGTYHVSVLANPDGRLHEQATDNNQSLREIKLSGKPDTRTVTVEQVGIIEEEGYGGTG